VKKFLKKLLSLHKILGLLASIFIISLSISGLYLNHTDLFSSKNSSNQVLNRLSFFKNQDYTWLQRNDGLYIEDKQGNTKKVRLTFPSSKIKFMIYTSVNNFYLVFNSDFLLKKVSDSPLLWKQIFFPKDHSQLLSVSHEKNSLLLRSERGLYRLNNQGENWDVLEQYPYSLKQFFWAIHSGFFFQPLLLYLNDFAAISLILLTLSGLILYFKRR